MQSKLDMTVSHSSGAPQAPTLARLAAVSSKRASDAAWALLGSLLPVYYGTGEPRTWAPWDFSWPTLN